MIELTKLQMSKKLEIELLTKLTVSLFKFLDLGMMSGNEMIVPDSVLYQRDAFHWSSPSAAIVPFDGESSSPSYQLKMWSILTCVVKRKVKRTPTRACLDVDGLC